MVCFVCRTASPGCEFSFDTAFENIRKHYKLMEIELQERGKENEELKERNNKLTKAIECLKNPTTIARLNSFSQQQQQQKHEPTTQLPSPIFEDITINIDDDDEEDNALISVMDTALNGSALNTSCNTEVITETEQPNWQGRRRALKLRSKTTENAKKIDDSNDSKEECNDENKKPLSKSTEISVGKQNTDLEPKEIIVNANKNSIKRLALRQTRLPFDKKSNKTLTRTHTLGNLNKANETNSQSDEDVFNFNKSISFQFKSPSPKKSKLHNTKTYFMPFPKTPEESSLIIMPSPTQTVYFLDDTADESEKRLTPKKVKRLNFDKEDGYSNDSLVNFDLPKVNDQDEIKKPYYQLKTSTQRLGVSSTNVKIKEEILTQKVAKKPINPVYKDSDTAEESGDEELSRKKVAKKPINPVFKDSDTAEESDDEELSRKKVAKKPINPVFKDSDTAEESDDDFIVRPIQVKVEPEEKKIIDIDSIKCLDCRNYIKFCGDRMTVEKLEEHIRNCVNHNNKRKADPLRGETPEGFWNPLLISFAEDDPRNEVLIDNRFKDKSKPATSRKNS